MSVFSQYPEQWAKKKPGVVLLSHLVAQTVSSPMRGLTSGFGMEPGVTPSLRTPDILNVKRGNVAGGFTRDVSPRIFKKEGLYRGKNTCN